MAKEFNEMSVTRTISLEWTLFFLGFFMSGLSFENMAASNPELSLVADPSIPNNYVLKFFIGSFIYLFVGCG